MKNKKKLTKEILVHLGFTKTVKPDFLFYKKDGRYCYEFEEIEKILENYYKKNWLILGFPGRDPLYFCEVGDFIKMERDREEDENIPEILHIFE